ncbi:MAG: hypothetical protein IJX40_00865 [Alistipes sp.]|nr:hypothetical protein [Alistipes sp.]
MTNKLFKSFFAVVAILGVALGFTSCEKDGDKVADDPKIEVSASSLNFTNAEGEQTVDITSNANWEVKAVNVDWVTVTPMSGNGNKTITVSVAENNTGEIRETTIKVVALHATLGDWDTKSIKVSQSATEAPTVDEELLYGDNFDGEEATKTYGSGSSWPFIDQFTAFANAEGPASDNVTYSGNGVSVRANSASNSDYSDYKGSGLNNIFFGKSAYFQINNIALNAAQASYKLTFGTEKFDNDNKEALFDNAEFHVLLSMDGYGWSEIEYEYAGTAAARWNVATANFTLTTVPENLYIKFVADVDSVYRIDDVKLFVGNGGQQVTLTPGEAPEEGTIIAAINTADGESVKVDEATVIAIYNRGFLMEDATGKLLVYTNETATVTIGTKVSVEGTVTSYGGFKQFAAIKDADGNYGPAPTVTTIAEGTFTQPAPKTMDGAAMDAYLNNPTIEYVEYTGVLTISGSYYNVTVEDAQTAIGSISYPIAGAVDAADGQTIVVRGYTIGTSSSKYVNTMLVECTAEGEAPELEVKEVTIAGFLEAEEDNTWYKLTGVIGEIKSADYGNFYISDDTDETYVYGLYDAEGNKVFTSLGLKTGDTITLRGRRSSYKEVPQVASAVYISHVAGAEVEQPENEATLSFADVANRTSYTTEQQVWEQNGITLTNNKGESTNNVGDYSAPARFYKSSNLTVETEKAMTKIVFACNSATYATALQGSITSGAVTVDGSIVTVTLADSATSYSIASLGAQVRMNSLTVTFAE